MPFMSKTRAIILSPDEEAKIQKFLELNPFIDFSTLARTAILIVVTFSLALPIHAKDSMTVEEAVASMGDPTALQLAEALKLDALSYQEPWRLYDAYLDRRYELLAKERVKLIEVAFSIANKIFYDDSGRARPDRDDAYRSVSAGLEFHRGVLIPRVRVPNEFERTIIEYAIRIHEIEHLIQNNRLLHDVIGSDADRYLRDDSLKLLGEESAMRAEWAFLSSLPDHLIEGAIELTQTFEWNNSNIDAITKAVILRILNSKKFPNSEAYLEHERRFGNRLNYRSDSRDPLPPAWLGLTALSCKALFTTR